MLHRSNAIVVTARIIPAQFFVSGQKYRNWTFWLSTVCIVRCSTAALESTLATNVDLEGQHTQPDQTMAENHCEDKDEDNEHHVESLTLDRLGDCQSQICVQHKSRLRTSAIYVQIARESARRMPETKDPMTLYLIRRFLGLGRQRRLLSCFLGSEGLRCRELVKSLR